VTLVVCPNLAIDRMLAAGAVRPGETTRCRELRTQAGGKGGNVARAMGALGGAAVLTGFAAGRAGRVIEELARDEGLELDVAITGGEARVSTVVLGDDGSVTRLYELGPELGPLDERALVDLVGARTAVLGEWAVITGAAPPGVSPGFYGVLVRAVHGAGYRAMVDAADEQLTGALAERPHLVKVNLAEACSAVGRPEAHCEDEQRASDAQLVAEGLELCWRLIASGARDAVVTLGAAGAAAVLGGVGRHVRSAPVRTVSPVGSGDCFAAGLALALGRGDGPDAALRLAAGAAAANATSPYNGHVDPDLARELAAGAFVGPPAT